MTTAAPSGVVTFLFTDIEGSTRRWESDAEGMRVALAAHDEVLRGAIDAQRELQLPVRMGLATGEAELRGADYYGAVLNRAARVMTAGHGGQILLADSTAGLVGGTRC
jgi:class 3 adenylate cyclase